MLAATGGWPGPEVVTQPPSLRAPERKHATVFGRSAIIYIRRTEKLGDKSGSMLLHLFLRANLQHSQLIKGFGFVEPEGKI